MERPDLQALRAGEAGATAALKLAERHSIPDPTLRAGYVYDQFTAAGNQRNSVFVGLSLPLPVFDRGQGDAVVAATAAANARRARLLLEDQAGRGVATLAARGADLEARRARLRGETLPLARRVIATLDATVARGGAPLPDLLLARRTLGELLLDGASLDLDAFRLDTARARLEAAGPAAPHDLARFFDPKGDVS